LVSPFSRHVLQPYVRVALKPSVRANILERDSFTCTYCGAQPGNDLLRATRIIPRGVGGSDHDNNLITACGHCNDGKSNQLSIPERMCEAPENDDGWTTWRTWGRWRLYWNPWGAYLDYGNDGYPIELHRVHEHDWISHCRGKGWPSDKFADFCEGIEFARTLIRSDYRERGSRWRHASEAALGGVSGRIRLTSLRDLDRYSIRARPRFRGIGGA
jgi:hypothetical protein